MLTASKYLRLFHHLPIHLFELFRLVTYFRLKQRYWLSLLIYIDFLINFILQKSQEAVLKVLWSLFQSPLGTFQLTIIQSLLSQFLTCFLRWSPQPLQILRCLLHLFHLLLQWIWKICVSALFSQSENSINDYSINYSSIVRRSNKINALLRSCHASRKSWICWKLQSPFGFCCPRETVKDALTWNITMTFYTY